MKHLETSTITHQVLGLQRYLQVIYLLSRPLINFIHGARHLCTRSRIDGITAMRWQTSEKIANARNLVEFVYSRQQNKPIRP